MKPKNEALRELLELRSKPKFEPDRARLYPGLEDEELKEAISKLIDQSIDEFILLVNSNGSESNFQALISTDLEYFGVFGLDTEDRERVCSYFEEIMDAIGLESSGGTLNRWLYGFDL